MAARKKKTTKTETKDKQMSREELLELELMGSKWVRAQQETVVRTKDLENFRLRIQAMESSVKDKNTGLAKAKTDEKKAKDLYNTFMESVAENHGVKPGFGYDELTGRILVEP